MLKAVKVVAFSKAKCCREQESRPASVDLLQTDRGSLNSRASLVEANAVTKSVASFIEAATVIREVRDVERA